LVLAKWLFFSVALFLFSASAFSQVNESVWYNDRGNDSCLVAYSDKQNYSYALIITAVVLVENNCGKPIVADIGFYEKDFGSIELDSVEAKSVLEEKPKSVFVFSERTAERFLFKKAYSGMSIDVGETQFKVFLKPKTLSGEFLVAVIDSSDPDNFSALDPWWDAESAADAFTLALWHFNDNAGLTAIDSSSNGNDLTLTHASIWDAVTKKFGASSISPNNLYYGTQASLFDTVPAVWSVSAWVAPTSLYNNTIATSETWFSRCGGAGCGATKLECFWKANNGYLNCYIETGGSTYTVATDKNSWAQDEWHYVQLIYDGANLKLRVDGFLGASGSVVSANLPNGDYTWVVGIDWDLASNQSLFRVDEMEVASVDRNITVPGAAAASGDLNILRVDGYDVNATPFFSYFHDGNLTIDFNVSNADNNRLKLDFNYSSSAVQGTGTRIFEDLNLTSLVCPVQDWSGLPSTCHLDWNISSLLVSDGNYYLLFDLNRRTVGSGTGFFKASGKTVGIANTPMLRVFSWDENKMTKILTANAIVNGTTYSSGADGNILVPAYLYSGEKIVSIGQDGNYARRNYLIDFGNFPNTRDFNAVLLKDVNGQSVGFEFYSEDGLTKLTNELVIVIKDMAVTPVPDNNIAGIARLSDGKASFFLNPDANYVFKVGSAYYYKVQGTVQLPKNEVSLATISPFDLTVSGIGSVRYLANAAPVVHYFFANTTSSYIFDVNAGLSYYNRQYFVSAKGNPHTYSLQPYLVARADSIQSVFFVRNSVSAAGIPDIRIKSQKNIPSQGTVTVEDVITDSAGEGVLSFITNDTYYLYFYRDGTMVYNVELRPTSTSYQIYLDLDKIVVSETTWAIVDVNFMPKGGIAWTMPDGNIDLNQRITVSGTTILNTRVLITNYGNRPSGTVLYDKNFDANSLTQFFQQEFDVDVNLSTMSPIKVTVYVTLSDGNVRVFSASYSISGSTSVGGQLFLALTTVFPEQFGAGGMMIISFLIILFVVGGTFGMGVDMGGSGILAVIVAAALAYLGWLPWLLWGAMALGATVMYVLTKRVEY